MSSLYEKLVKAEQGNPHATENQAQLILEEAKNNKPLTKRLLYGSSIMSMAEEDTSDLDSILGTGRCLRIARDVAISGVLASLITYGVSSLNSTSTNLSTPQKLVIGALAGLSTAAVSYRLNKYNREIKAAYMDIKIEKLGFDEGRKLIHFPSI